MGTVKKTLENVWWSSAYLDLMRVEEFQSLRTSVRGGEGQNEEREREREREGNEATPSSRHVVDSHGELLQLTDTAVQLLE